MPAAVAAIPLLAGAAAGVFLFDSAPDRLILAAAGAAVVCLVAGLGFLADDAGPAVVACVSAGCVAAGYAGGASAARDLYSPSLLVWFESAAADAGEPVVVEGRLREDAARTGYGAVLTLDVHRVRALAADALPVRGGVRLVVGGTPSADEVETWRAGRTVRAPALLRRPAAFSNPGVADDRRAQALRGTVLTGSVKSAALVEVISRGGRMSERAASTRSWTRRTITQHVGRLDARSAAVATAILVGDRTGLSDEDTRRLQDAGTYHVIAISGGNIAILAAVLVIGARALRVPSRTGAASAIVILLFYAEVAGGSASVGRAISAAVIFLAAAILDHRGAPLNVLAVAAILAAAATPAAMFDGGFLLSFGATAAILVGVPRMLPAPVVERGPRAARIIRASTSAAGGVAAATLCAEIALAPIGAALFSKVTLAGLVLNFAAIPLMTVVQCGAMALVVSAAAGLPGEGTLGQLVHHASWGLVESARLADAAPWLVFDVSPPSAWLCAVYYLAAAALVAVPRVRCAAAIVLVVAGAALLSGASPAASAPVPALPTGVLRVVVLDVGQGDATVAILPDGRALLVDAGGLAGTSFDVGSRIVVPALRALGVRRLHALVLTHADPDHSGGAEAVLGRLNIAAVWEGVPVPPHAVRRRLLDLARQRRVVWRTVRPGDTERAGGVDIIVHHPPPPDWERQRVRNDDSVVLELRYGAVSILLPGDIGREVEAALIPRLDLAPTVVLKAPHHGSATSSSDPFIEAIRPAAVIFSAGRNNRFGHPATAVVERYERRGIPMFNTAADGAVFVDTDGRGLEVRAWTGNRKVTAQSKQDDATTRRHD